jgi:hypothetical protein
MVHVDGSAIGSDHRVFGAPRQRSTHHERRGETMTTEELELQVDKLFRDLHRDLDGTVPAERVSAVGRAYYHSLRQDAAINDFIPLLVYRFASEELDTSSRVQLHGAKAGGWGTPAEDPALKERKLALIRGAEAQPWGACRPPTAVSSNVCSRGGVNSSGWAS